MFDFIWGTFHCPPSHIPPCVGVFGRVDEAVVCCHGSRIMKEGCRFSFFNFLIFLIGFLSLSMYKQCARCAPSHQVCGLIKRKKEKDEAGGLHISSSETYHASVFQARMNIDKGSSSNWLKPAWCCFLKTSMRHGALEVLREAQVASVSSKTTWVKTSHTSI